MEEKNIKEWAILIALFKATIEQQSMLIGTTKQEAKLIFNRWSKEGEKLLRLIEKNSNLADLEEITEIIEDSVNRLRALDYKGL